MLVVISYDISDTKRRNKVARLLEGAGSRVLESVFECDLTPAQWTKVKQRLAKRLKADEDRARFYFLCQTCAVRTEILGGGSVETSPTTYIV
ncbi:MAG: CRISPR-associated endonuclease Cas2 [Chloroflexota bacterium]|mgnify:CR=1 FL=1